MKKAASKPKPILLPQSEEQFDELVDAVCDQFKLKNREHAESVIAIRISHLPPDQGTATLEYFGHCVVKNIAYQIAQNKCQKAQQKQQLAQLEALLQASPNDQQALDALQKASDEGSSDAKDLLAKYRGETDSSAPPDLRIVEPSAVM